MPRSSLSLDLNSSQVARLEKLLRAGFRFIMQERYGGYFGVERDGFVTLIDPGGGKLRLFGQAGYLMADGIGMLVERSNGKAFVWHQDSIPATPALLEKYQRFRAEIEELLREE